MSDVVNNRRRNMKRLLLVLAATVAMVAALATPAHADVYWSNCDLAGDDCVKQTPMGWTFSCGPSTTIQPKADLKARSLGGDSWVSDRKLWVFDGQTSWRKEWPAAKLLADEKWTKLASVRTVNGVQIDLMTGRFDYVVIGAGVTKLQIRVSVKCVNIPI